ncbi:MAG: HDIG domain-containing protein [Candidatus Aenigmarchaeota archaeon]|nr:HDIG domain-containing protein [Candidatus Aenigmarchaeota archaeon]
MKRLLAFANKIKNKKLREKTIKLLKEPAISNKEMIYPKAKLEKAPSWVGAHHNYEGGLLDHTVSVVNLCLSMADNFEKMYKVKVNTDYLISGALLHDIMKVFILKKRGRNWELTGSLLDHADFSACELYARGFPEEVVHIVAAHGGDSGASYPRTPEATLVYYADVLDASIESQIHASPLQNLQLLLMGGE